MWPAVIEFAHSWRLKLFWFVTFDLWSFTLEGAVELTSPHDRRKPPTQSCHRRSSLAGSFLVPSNQEVVKSDHHAPLSAAGFAAATATTPSRLVFAALGVNLDVGLAVGEPGEVIWRMELCARAPPRLPAASSSLPVCPLARWLPAVSTTITLLLRLGLSPSFLTRPPLPFLSGTCTVLPRCYLAPTFAFMSLKR